MVRKLPSVMSTRRKERRWNKNPESRLKCLFPAQAAYTHLTTATFRNLFFQRCDVSNWSSVLSFFKNTYNVLGPIDAVVSNAAINVVESLDDDIDTATGELQAPDLSVLNVNAVGTWYVTKCAIHFFKKHPETRSQLVLFGSVASLFDTPPLYTYCASKAAVLGLMRALRTQLPKDNITVNMIAPWMTSEIPNFMFPHNLRAYY